MPCDVHTAPQVKRTNSAPSASNAASVVQPLTGTSQLNMRSTFGGDAQEHQPAADLSSADAHVDHCDQPRGRRRASPPNPPRNGRLREFRNHVRELKRCKQPCQTQLAQRPRRGPCTGLRPPVYCRPRAKASRRQAPTRGARPGQVFQARLAGARRAGRPEGVFGIVGIFALKLAVGSGGKATTQRGALMTIAHRVPQDAADRHRGRPRRLRDLGVWSALGSVTAPNKRTVVSSASLMRPAESRTPRFVSPR
jgi:hypothetical protein